MKNNILIIIIMMIPACFFAQTGNVGVATTVPNTTLDINGTTNVNNEINLGGTNTSSGSSGTLGDLISANGATNPQWKKFDLPSGYLDGLVLSAIYLASSQTGVSFPGTNNSAALSVGYAENQAIASNWKEIAGVQQTFTVSKAVNLVNISVQTLAQVVNGANASFGCGIYIDGQLKFVRTGVVSGSSGSYRTLNLNASLPNLTVANHTFRFACAERNVATGVTLGIGTALDAATINPEMAGTSVSIKILEPIQ